jgi:hypothetical protein
MPENLEPDKCNGEEGWRDDIYATTVSDGEGEKMYCIKDDTFDDGIIKSDTSVSPRKRR